MFVILRDWGIMDLKIRYKKKLVSVFILKMSLPQ